MSNMFPVIDLHEDLLLHINRRDLYPSHWQTNYSMLERNKVKIVVATAFPVPEGEDFFHVASNDLIEEDFRQYATHCATADNWRVVRAASDVDAVLETDGAHGVLMHVEGLNVFSGEWDRLERWYDVGWRSLGIVWNLTNPFGGGTSDASSGLTALGAEMLEWLQDRKMIVDFAHMNQQTFADAIRFVRGPIIVSHGNAATCCPSPRNYTDEQLRIVANSGGVVGIFFAKTFVTGDRPATIEDVVRHVDHLRDVCGEEHIALGTDFGGIVSGHVHDLDSLDVMDRFWDALARRGYTTAQMEKIAFRNARRALTTILV